ncbi:MAG: hypothetical protein U1F66_12955 [bacterium]
MGSVGNSAAPAIEAKDPADPTPREELGGQPATSSVTDPEPYSNPNPPVFGTAHDVSYASASVPGHPEGGLSPGYDVGHLVDFRVVLKGERQCRIEGEKELVKFSGHIEKDGVPIVGAPFLRIVFFDVQRYLDTPLAPRGGIDGSFEFFFVGLPAKELGFFLPKPIGNIASSGEWNQILPWPEAESPTEGFFFATNPFGDTVEMVSAPGRVGPCPPRLEEVVGVFSREVIPFRNLPSPSREDSPGSQEDLGGN